MASKKVRRLVIDTETTGLLKPEIADLEQQPRIIEFAIAEINSANNVVAEHVWLINPGQSLTSDIIKLTGLTDDALLGMPSFIEVLPEIEEVFLGASGIIAHNLTFDLSMLVNELRLVGREHAFPYPPNQICTVQLANELIFGRRAKMCELYEKVTGKPLAQTHRAMDDVRALVEILHGLKW